MTIIKSNIRANGVDLAYHLQRTVDKDGFDQTFEIAEVRGTVADDVMGAFKEMEAVAAGTKGTKPLFSLSINPSEPMTREQYATAIDQLEEAHNLVGQPRVVVFHNKKGREHAHVVWSRVDAENMKIIHNSFDRQRNRDMARKLAHQFGHKLPEGLEKDRGTDRFNERSRKNWAEYNQEKRTGITKDQRITEITAAYREADNGASFVHALEERGYHLAQGQRRAYVVVDMAGEVFSVSRHVEDAKAREIKIKLADRPSEKLPSVERARVFIAGRAMAQAERSRETANTIDEMKTAKAHATAAMWAENKAANTEFKALREGLHAREAKALAEVSKRVKEGHKPEWRDLLQRQEQQRKGMDYARRTAYGRVKHLLKNLRGENLFNDQTKGSLAPAFRWVIKGEAPGLAKQQDKERKALGTQQSKAVKREQGQVRQGFTKERNGMRHNESTRRSQIRGTHALAVGKIDMAIAKANEKSQEQAQLKAHGVSKSGREKTSGMSKSDLKRAYDAFNQRSKEPRSVKSAHSRAARGQERGGRGDGPGGGGRSMG